MVLAGGETGYLQIWDLINVQEVCRITAHEGKRVARYSFENFRGVNRTCCPFLDPVDWTPCVSFGQAIQGYNLWVENDSNLRENINIHPRRQKLACLLICTNVSEVGEPWLFIGSLLSSGFCAQSALDPVIQRRVKLTQN